MQTKGGGKHDILPAADAGSDRALLPVNDAPRTRCGHVPHARFNDAKSMEECMAHQSQVPQASTPSTAYDQLEPLTDGENRHAKSDGNTPN